MVPIGNPEQETVEQTRHPYAKPAFPYRVLYIAAALILADQASDLLTGLAPYRWSAVEWRFGAYGILLGRTTSLVLVDVLIVIAAAARGDRRVLRWVAVLHAMLGLVVVTWLPLFCLDFLEFKRRIPPDRLPTVYYATGRAAAIAVLVALYGWAVAIGLFRVTRHRAVRADESPLLVTRRTGPNG